MKVIIALHVEPDETVIEILALSGVQIENVLRRTRIIVGEADPAILYKLRNFKWVRTVEMSGPLYVNQQSTSE